MPALSEANEPIQPWNRDLIKREEQIIGPMPIFAWVEEPLTKTQKEIQRAGGHFWCRTCCLASFWLLSAVGFVHLMVEEHTMTMLVDPEQVLLAAAAIVILLLFLALCAGAVGRWIAAIWDRKLYRSVQVFGRLIRIRCHRDEPTTVFPSGTGGVFSRHLPIAEIRDLEIEGDWLELEMEKGELIRIGLDPRVDPYALGNVLNEQIPGGHTPCQLTLGRCQECGSDAPRDLLIEVHGRRYCEHCKPLLEQRLREGVA